MPCIVLLTGNPPFEWHTFQPHVIEKAGEKRSWAQTLGFVWMIIRHLPGLIASRPGVLNARAEKV